MCISSENSAKKAKEKLTIKSRGISSSLSNKFWIKFTDDRRAFLDGVGWNRLFKSVIF